MKETPMNIGAWLQQMRRKRQFDLRELATRTGLDIGTISKIENGRTQSTLGTVVRAGVGLGVTAKDFIENWQGRPFSLLAEPHGVGDETVPTLQDVEAFVICARRERRVLCVWMVDALNSIASLQGEVIPFFEPEVIEKLLFGPLWHRYELHYPPEMTSESILDILGQAGVLLVSDISAHLKKAYDKNRTQILPNRLNGLLTFSLQGGNHVESVSVERIKMLDVLLLDRELQQGGNLLAMFWSVCLFQVAMLHPQAHSVHVSALEGAVVAEQEVRAVLVFLTLCRWLQYQNGHDPFWIGDLRRRFRQLDIRNTL